MSATDSLNAETLRAALGDQLIGNRIVVLEETTSTNDVIAQMAPESSEGLVVIAERQTAGRGQYGRRWESASSQGIWLSVLLRPNIALTDSGRITDLLVRTLIAAVSQTISVDAAIKPPNDVYISGRKVAGVLAEMRVEQNGGYCALAGLGLNVNQAIGDFPPELQSTAGSLAMTVGHPLDRFDLTVALLRNLNARYDALVPLRKGL